MQIPAKLCAGVGLVLSAILLSGPLGAQSAPQPTNASRMIITGGEAAARRSEEVTVLRGSAIAPKPAGQAATALGRWTVVSGEKLWLVDPASGQVVSCRSRGTSTVGKRIVACITDDLPARVID